MTFVYARRSLSYPLVRESGKGREKIMLEKNLPIRGGKESFGKGKRDVRGPPLAMTRALCPR